MGEMIGASLAYALLAFFPVLWRVAHPSVPAPLKGIKLKLFALMVVFSLIITFAVEVIFVVIQSDSDIRSILVVVMVYFVGKALRDWLIGRKLVVDKNLPN